MRILRSLFFGVGVIATVVLTTGCLTQRMPLSTKDSPIKTDSADGLSATLRFLDDATLKKKFREEINPFLTDYNTMHLRRVMVFELTVKNQGPKPVLFIMNQLELQFGGKSLQPYNRFQLEQHWEFTDEERKTKGAHKAMRENIIKDFILQNSFTIPTQGGMKGYLVFVGNTPNYGPAKLYLPLFASKDEVLHRFEFPFSF